jgi:hypothetical protein
VPAGRGLRHQLDSGAHAECRATCDQPHKGKRLRQQSSYRCGGAGAICAVATACTPEHGGFWWRQRVSAAQHAQSPLPALVLTTQRWRRRRRRSLTLHAGGARSQDQQQCCAGQHTAQHGCWKLQGGLGGWWGWGACLGHPWITAKVASLTAARTLHSLAALYRRLTKGLCHDMAAAGTCARSMRHAFGRLPCACPLPLLQCSLACVSHCLQQEQGIQKGMQFGSAQCLGGSEGVTGGRPGVRAVQPSVWDARGDVQVDRPGSCKGAWVDGAAVSWQLRAHPQPGGRRQGCK